MELGQIEAFVEAQRRGSITAAAEALELTQPTLTARIRSLEAELGVALLTRGRRGVTLTPAGRRFLPRALAALDALGRAAAEARAAREVRGGTLAVGLASDVAVYLAPAGSLPELVARVEQLSSSAPVAKLERKAEPARSPESAPLQSRWKQLIEAVKAARKPAAASALEHGSPLKIDPSGVQLAFRRGDARAAIVAEVKADIEAVFERALGYRAPLQLVEQEPEGATVAEEKQKQRSAAQSGRLTLGREHPAVRSAVELLGGEIEDVRDLGEE